MKEHEKFQAYYQGRVHWNVGLTPWSVILYDWDSIMSFPQDHGKDPDTVEVKTIVPSILAEVGRAVKGLTLFRYVGKVSGMDHYEECT